MKLPKLATLWVQPIWKEHTNSQKSKYPLFSSQKTRIKKFKSRIQLSFYNGHAWLIWVSLFCEIGNQAMIRYWSGSRNYIDEIVR